MSTETSAANGARDRCCGIALGSNVGDRLENLRVGLKRLLEIVPEVRLKAVAPLFETAPVDCAPGAQAFYNTVVEITCGLNPHKLRELTAQVEIWMGRPEVRERNAPRTLDLDLLYCGELVVNDDVLTIPHPRLSQRRFVLTPLAALCPEKVLPGQVCTIRELLDALPADDAVVQITNGDWLEPT